MKVRVDSDLCTGHGRCYVLAGAVYQEDEEGFNAQLDSTIDVPAGLEEPALLGLKSCPEAAISQVEP